MRPTPLLLLLALPVGALAADSLPIHVYPCPRAEPAPVMDGRLDDPAWAKAPTVSGFTNFGSDKLAEVQTSFRVLWDERFLYLGLHCDEPQMAKINSVRFPLDEHAVFSHETIELFLDPDHDHDRYYQLAFNLAGSLYDGEREATVWNSGAAVKTSTEADGWWVELAVPWEPLKTRPAPGKVVGFNVCRDRNVGDKAWTNWARVMNGFHDPERFAHLVLSGTPEQVGALSREFRQGGRTGAIVVFSAEGFAQTSYVKLAAAAFAEVDGLMANLREECRRERNPAAAAEIKRRLDDFQVKLDALRQQSGGQLDAAVWTRLDLALQSLVEQLNRTVCEARLTALLNSI